MSKDIYTQPYGIIYCTTNLINNKKYIGQHKTSNLEDSYLGSGKLLIKAIKKYGSENFSRETLKVCYSQEELNEQEIHFITLFNAVLSEDYYNIAAGGSGGCIIKLYNEKNGMFGKNHSEETKKKISESHKGEKNYFFGKTHSNEFKEKMSNLIKGKNNPMFGKKHSKETLDIISNKLKGRVLSEEHKNKLSKSLKARKLPIATCPHCNKSGDIANMKRWHFDNCKFKLF